MIIYPDENYDSWISEDEADAYFETRLNAEKWDVANKESALMTAFRSLREFNLDILFEDDKTFADSYTETEKAEILSDLQDAQCEQVLHELNYDLDNPAISSLSMGGVLSVKLSKDQKSPPSRYSNRTLLILRPYTIARSITRTR